MLNLSSRSTQPHNKCNFINIYKLFHYPNMLNTNYSLAQQMIYLKVSGTTIIAVKLKQVFCVSSPSRNRLFCHNGPAVCQTVQHRSGLGAPLPHLLFQRPSALDHLQQSMEHRSVSDQSGQQITWQPLMHAFTLMS